MFTSIAFCIFIIYSIYFFNNHVILTMFDTLFLVLGFWQPTRQTHFCVYIVVYRWVVSDSLLPHRLQHARLLCPSLSQIQFAQIQAYIRKFIFKFGKKFSKKIYNLKSLQGHPENQELDMNSQGLFLEFRVLKNPTKSIDLIGFIMCFTYYTVPSLEARRVGAP